MNQKGLTLLEIILVIFLIGIIFLFVIKFYDSYFNQSHNLGEYEQAKSLMVKGMEEEKKRYIESDTNLEYENKLIDHYTRGDYKYNVYSDIKNVTENGNLDDIHGLAEIKIKVVWESKNLEVKSYVNKK
jgi:prepilin-type N-terminal cleavage/methylation domain-containing protein